MNTTLTILVDNTARGRGIIAEHGFAVWITRGGEQTLFDTGGGHALTHNLESLHKDVCKVGRVILSHGHWDHTGGLMDVLKLRDHTEIIAHPGIFDERYSERTQDGRSIYNPLSLPFARHELEQAGAHFRLTREYTELLPGMWFSGESPRPQGWTSSDQGLVIRRDNSYSADPVLDDASLLLDTERGPVVLLGCAHAGVDVILDDLAQKSGYTTFHAVIGGMHLMKANKERLRHIIQCLERYKVQQIAATHCTGFSAMAQLFHHFPTRFEAAYTGKIFQY